MKKSFWQIVVVLAFFVLNINVFASTPEDCNLTGLRTFTQGGWGSKSNSTPGKIRDLYFDQVFPNDLVIGGLKTIKFTSADAVKNFFPAGSTPYYLTNNYINPLETSAGIFAGQVAAFAMNLFYDDAGYLSGSIKKLRNLVITRGPFEGITVGELFIICNKALGGENTGYTFSELNDAATAINENFVDGNTNKGFLTCGTTPKITNWTGSLGSNETICFYDAKLIEVQGQVSLTPSNIGALLQTTWRVTYPENADHSLNTVTKNINGSTSFTINSTWPGITSTDTKVEIEYTVNVLDLDGNSIHAPIVKTITWTPSVCPPPSPKEADLRIEKSVNESEFVTGELVEYKIKITNDGPNTSENIEVTDLLPTGLQFKSYSATQGSYDGTTGKWLVGTLENGASAEVTIIGKVVVALTETSIFDLGPAKGFNLFVLEDLNQPSSDTEGKVAVGRNAYLSGYSVGDKLPNSNSFEDVLIVGNNLQYEVGAVYSGNVVYGNSSNLPKLSVSVLDGIVRKDYPIDFEAAAAHLKTLSNQLSLYPVNGTTSFQWGEVRLTGTDPYLNVFEVSGADLTLANNFAVDVPSGSVVLVNISGLDVKWSGGLDLGNADKINVLYNFNETTALKIYGIDVRGSILAPFAAVNFVAGVQNGQMIAKSVTGQGQFNNTMFIGNIPKSVNIVNTAEVTKSSIKDPDSTPGNGNTTEDDYSLATIKVTNTVDPSGNGNTEWKLVSDFKVNEVVLTLANDLEGSILAGTLGGKIYKSKDNMINWTTLDLGLVTSYIWDLAVSNAGHIYAATEKGLFKSIDNGLTWELSSLGEKDVRSVVIDQAGNIYAGLWSLGVFKSADNGLSFNEINVGIESKAVHALALNSNNELFSGSFGSGVSKYSNSWINLPVGYQHIWSLGITSDNTIYAGSYGNGVYCSKDNGNTWVNMISLPAKFIYNITVDKADNVYVSSWSGGVFALQNGTDTWLPLGVPGSRVSSILINPASNALFVGTENGMIYTTDQALSTGNENQTPYSFEMKQNYPNPFNPSTTINFSVAKAGQYSLKVYNILGQEVATLFNKNVTPGNYTEVFNASSLSTGVYIYRLQGNDVNISKKMILTK